jgi:hypothetical protein
MCLIQQRLQRALLIRALAYHSNIGGVPDDASHPGGTASLKAAADNSVQLAGLLCLRITLHPFNTVTPCLAFMLSLQAECCQSTLTPGVRPLVTSPGWDTSQRSWQRSNVRAACV